MRTSALEWGVAAATIPGETESGDSYVVEAFDQGVLVAVIDGLGHGVPAAEAARAAASLICKNAGESVIKLVQQCDRQLLGTRGVVMSLASIDTSNERVTWVGVGNVDGFLFRADLSHESTSQYLHASPGVVGARLPTLRAAVVPIAQGDTLILVTDGIRGGFNEGLSLKFSPQRIADSILAQHRLQTDDALVLVARLEGLNP